MSRSQDGRADFDAVIGPHLDAGYRTALAILRDPDQAHDAVQESAFKAWRKLHQLREGKPARPWFLAIVANQCRSERRRRWWSVVRVAEVEGNAKRPDEGASAASLDIDRELAKLPREDRLALFLFLPRPSDGGGRRRAGRERRRRQDPRLPGGQEAAPRTGDGLMDELRSEIRAAFEKEQAGLAPAAALRRNLVDAVAAQQRPTRNFQWVAVAAAVLLAILVVAGLMSTRLLARHANVNSPRASPARQATPVAQDYGPPPAGVNLLYVHDPNNPSWLIGYDWTGQPRGTVKLAQPLGADQVIGMAPDGQAFAVGLNAKGGNWTYYDRLGAPISTPPPTLGAFLPMWADDNRHICSMSFDQQTFAWALGTQLAGEGRKQVAIIATDSGLGQTSLALVSCSFHNDQAIVVRTTNSSPAELWVVRISDGKVLCPTARIRPPARCPLVGSRRRQLGRGKLEPIHVGRLEELGGIDRSSVAYQTSRWSPRWIRRWEWWLSAATIRSCSSPHLRGSPDNRRISRSST